jgi:ActR/RegA family two-component response regulator
VVNCARPEADKLGAAIARDYAFTNTEQVMGWFCNGAEFEDILVALETAEQTGVSAEDMLVMLAAGLTWEEIWQVVGLTD